MSAQVPRPMFVDYLSLFPPWCVLVIVDNGCASAFSNDGSQCSVGENTTLSETEDASVTESSNVLTLDAVSSDNTSMTWSKFVVSVEQDGSIEYDRISSEGGTAKDSVGVSEFEISVELENRKVWQPSC